MLPCAGLWHRLSWGESRVPVFPLSHSTTHWTDTAERGGGGGGGGGEYKLGEACVCQASMDNTQRE